MIFEIIIQGNLTDEWSDWFEGLSILHEIEDETKISGQIEDQAVLFGLLKKVRDLGLPLISVNQIMDKKSSRRKNEK
ncbi:hypothetical protein EG832_12850 [bacterium]|nr:hypothetical protein [bacterium]